MTISENIMEISARRTFLLLQNKTILSRKRRSLGGDSGNEMTNKPDSETEKKEFTWVKCRCRPQQSSALNLCPRSGRLVNGGNSRNCDDVTQQRVPRLTEAHSSPRLYTLLDSHNASGFFNTRKAVLPRALPSSHIHEPMHPHTPVAVHTPMAAHMTYHRYQQYRMPATPAGALNTSVSSIERSYSGDSWDTQCGEILRGPVGVENDDPLLRSKYTRTPSEVCFVPSYDPALMRMTPETPQKSASGGVF
eukprot:Gregarina_sp_Poly_1__7195@NODE_394_length_8954_cov_220_544278_g323_i0_p4_GENE_NODE_394_length_8954_cov_220_544278_g323_i0NODE_394_length_8954_cov_220_544278_g323_i0_p4_ORF_typecomplete_len249_score22_04_NODE_394_length_8954_cov_220_544278_g323_i0151897